MTDQFTLPGIFSPCQGPYFLLLDDPLAFASCVAPGVACWIAYFIVRLRPRATAP
jgi:hypothetical protein